MSLLLLSIYVGRIWNFITLRTKKGKSKENVKSAEKEDHAIDSPKADRDTMVTFDTPDKFKVSSPLR